MSNFYFYSDHSYSEERRNSVPLIKCRICPLEFFADKEQEHSKYCLEKTMTEESLYQTTLKFMDLSNQTTECMIKIEKSN